jgi:hypothetical protein
MILNYDPNQFPSEDKVRTMVYAITWCIYSVRRRNFYSEQKRKNLKLETTITSSFEILQKEGNDDEEEWISRAPDLIEISTRQKKN